MAKSFTLRAITASDVPSCAHVAGLAFEADRHTQLKARSPTNPYDHEAGMKGALTHWLNRPVDMTVAVDNGEIIGWVVWGFRGFDDKSQQDKKSEQEEKQSKREEEQAIKHEKKEEGKQENKQEDKEPTSTRSNLESHTGSDMAAWMERLMPPGSKCMFICSIVVHPAHQGRGVGSALIRKGTNRADAEGVYCWVHASEAGAGMFQKQGFHEVGRLEVDLDEWNVENITAPEGPDAKWGKYTFRYMRRDAQ